MARRTGLLPPGAARGWTGGFEREVRAALARLHDPAGLRVDPLLRFLRDTRPDDAGAGGALRADLLGGLAALEAQPRGGRLQQLLRRRYVDGLSAPVVQADLAIGKSAYYRQHDRAVAALAAVLRERWAAAPAATAPAGARPPASPIVVGEVRHHLPVALSSFVGREQELADVLALLVRTRLLTLVGTGGVGKTRLALRVAAEAESQVADGVWLVGLAPLSDPTLVASTLATVLGLRGRATRQPVDAAIAYLRPRTALLVLDNCEHLIEACADLAARLLPACPGLRLLATSREPLGVPGEVAWPVPPLDVPEPTDAPAVALARCAAVRLFAERAGAAQPAFVLGERNARAVADVCRQLDGLPLAIELAAARTRVLGVEEIAARLGDRFALLGAGARGVEERHRTLRRVVDWSFELLSAPEQALFRRLSVFAGGWTLDAAEAVCADDGAATLERAAILPLLTRLVDRSLVVASPQAGTTRYAMLETLRQYAREGLDASGELPALRVQHAAFFGRLAERAEVGLVGPDQGAWLDGLEHEHDNLRAALRWSIEGGEVELGLAMAWVLWRFWWVRGHLSEARQRVGELLEAASAQGATTARARGLATAGLLAVWQGDYASGRARLKAGLALAGALGERRAAAYALTFLARVARDQGEDAEARSFGDAAVALFRGLGDGWGLALALHFAGLATESVDLAAARAMFDESAALFERRGCAWDRAMPLRGLGIVAYRRGDHARAEAHFAESTRLFRERGDAWSVGMLVNDLAHTALARGDVGRAGELFRESLADWRQVGNERGLALALSGLACVAAARRRRRLALLLFGAAERACRERGVVLEPTARAARSAWLQRSRSGLGAGAAAVAWAEGETLALEEAIGAALEEAGSAPRARQAGLTAREDAVAGLVAGGLSNREIGERLVITERTAERHVENIRSKLGFRSRAQVAAWYQTAARAPVDQREMGTSPDAGTASGR